MIELFLGIICLIAGYFLRHSIKKEFLDNKKFKYPTIFLCMIFAITGYFYNDAYPIYGMFMYLWGNLL